MAQVLIHVMCWSKFVCEISNIAVERTSQSVNVIFYALGYENKVFCRASPRSTHYTPSHTTSPPLCHTNTLLLLVRQYLSHTNKLSHSLSLTLSHARLWSDKLKFIKALKGKKDYYQKQSSQQTFLKKFFLRHLSKDYDQNHLKFTFGRFLKRSKIY